MNSTPETYRRNRQPWRDRLPDAGPTRLLAFDLESGPDYELLPAGFDAATRFPKTLWHKVVAISVAAADIVPDATSGLERYEAIAVQSLGRPDWPEGRLLTSFWSLVASAPYRLVSFNGLRFDLPVLLARSLLHGVDASVFWRRGDKWTGYGARYSETWHADLLQLVSCQGATVPPSLDELAAALGLPGKIESGGAVLDMVAAGDLERVRRYCDVDTALTLASYLSWARTTGRVDEGGYRASVESLRTVLEGSSAPHLSAFSESWRVAERLRSGGRQGGSFEPQGRPDERGEHYRLGGQSESKPAPIPIRDEKASAVAASSSVNVTLPAG